MAKIKVADLHRKLAEAGIPIDGVALDRPGKPGISVDYQAEATPEQMTQAEAIIKDYDQEAEEAAKGDDTVTLDEINSLKTVADVKAFLIRQHNLKG